jgi:hypothetical protein
MTAIESGSKDNILVVVLRPAELQQYSVSQDYAGDGEAPMMKDSSFIAIATAATT